MPALIDFPLALQHPAIDALRGYLADVAAAVGIGLESCTVDHDTPVSAYLALDTRLPRHPDRDLALLWHEERGWAAAIETHSGEDLIILDHLGGPTVLPPPHRVARFLDDLRTRGPAGVEPPAIRTAGTHDDLARLLGQWHLPGQPGAA
ncbi:DUF6292 family protein [Actinokineospora soli]|uniref:DUF6292 family protein n=1 Tax=Actinokineospora soli TaxID=1048753 RepID=A0ABW2TPG5_9PSEU